MYNPFTPSPFYSNKLVYNTQVTHTNLICLQTSCCPSSRRPMTKRHSTVVMALKCFTRQLKQNGILLRFWF